MRRREAVLSFLAFGTAGLPLSALAQTRTFRIGVLAPGKTSIFLPAMMKRLSELGFVEGKNVAVEYRSPEGAIDRYPALAQELLRAKCDLIFAIGDLNPVRALQAAKTAVPVVIVAVTYDPVKAGIVRNLRQPDGNFTGMYLQNYLLEAKRLELLREILPKTRRFLVLADRITTEALEVVKSAASRLQLDPVVEFLEKSPYDIDAAIARGKRSGATALVVVDSRSVFEQRAKLSQAVIKHRMPAVVNIHYFDQPGFLASYGVDFATAFRRGGDMAASILRGTKPAMIPLEQPSEFELGINLKAAKELGTPIPAAVLARATRLVQ